MKTLIKLQNKLIKSMHFKILACQIHLNKILKAWEQLKSNNMVSVMYLM